MRNAVRKTGMKVRSGKVQQTNRSELTPHYLDTDMPGLVIDRRRPGRGYTHLVGQKQLREFVERLPEWDVLQQGLNAIVLDAGDRGCMGWCRSGVIAICAWENSLVWENCNSSFYDEHAEILEKLNVPVIQQNGRIQVLFNESTARAFQLVHILTHELGHHHDRMTTRSQKVTVRGEGYAEEYARRFEDEVIEVYSKMFGL